jgi:hypothetical protein
MMGTLLGPLAARTTQGAAEAADAAASPFPPGSFLLAALALVVIFACLLAAVKLYAAIRGGRLARGWSWFVFGFAAFGIAQLILCGGQVGIIPVWSVWVDGLRLASLALLLIGVSRLRKLLA